MRRRVILGIYLIKKLLRGSSSYSNGRKAGIIAPVSLLGLLVILIPAFTIWVVVSAADITPVVFGEITDCIGVF